MQACLLRMLLVASKTPDPDPKSLGTEQRDTIANYGIFLVILELFQFQAKLCFDTERYFQNLMFKVQSSKLFDAPLMHKKLQGVQS